jgi:hypothetical protein
LIRLITATLNAMLLVILAVCLLCGCDRQSLKLQYLADREQPIPSAHLPEDYRLKNWIGTNDRGSRGGSCFWASVYMCLRHADRPDLEEILIARRGDGFEGPEHLTSMCRKLASVGIPWAATEDGDIELLERASETRRWAAIGYYPGHAICFCGFYQSPQGEIAVLLDNNFPDDYIGVPRKLFEDSWKHAYGGMAVVPWVEPAIVNSYPRTRMITYDQSEPTTRHADQHRIAHRIVTDWSLLCSTDLQDGTRWLGPMPQRQDSLAGTLHPQLSSRLGYRHRQANRTDVPSDHARFTSTQQRAGEHESLRLRWADQLTAASAASLLSGSSVQPSADSSRTDLQPFSNRQSVPTTAQLRAGRSAVPELSELHAQSILRTQIPIRRWSVWRNAGPELWLSVWLAAAAA